MSAVDPFRRQEGQHEWALFQEAKNGSKDALFQSIGLHQSYFRRVVRKKMPRLAAFW